MAQRLETIIAINAQAGSGFSKVGNTLTEMGVMVDQLSQKIINFGKESVNVYVDYEKSMAEAKVALATTYGQGSTELEKVMKDLDGYATDWAATSIFHTNDVANAISEAAHAGWNYEEIVSAIPAAMELAEAGSLDLSEAVNYIVKSTNAAGVQFDDLGTFIDQWAYSANSSATTIEEMGQAMLTMGRTMSFTSSTEELFSMLSALADVGYVGSQAGTVLRNAMIRLVAPTDKASAAMAELGVSQEELNELSEDADYAAAAELIENIGLSVYDSEGNLRSMVDIFKDLNLAMSTLSDEDANSIMAAIFPTRTLAAGLALMEGAADGYNGIYEALLNGEAEGYGSYSSATMMDTLYGDIEIFYSKVENLKKTVGESLAEDISAITEDIGGFIDSIAGMDEDKMDALIGALEVFAAAGPTLLIAGAAMRLLGSKTAMAALAITGVIAGIKYLSEIDEARFENLFGDQELDSTALTTYIDTLGTAYDTAYNNVNYFNSALDNSVESYKNAASTFSSELLTKMLTKAELTDADITRLNSLGESINTAVMDSIGFSGDANAAFWESFFGVDHEEGTDNSVFNDIIDTSAAWYQELYAEAESIGNGLTEAMNEAFADGKLTDAERENIMSYIADYNDTVAKAQREWEDKQSQINFEKALWKSQNASWESVEEIAEAMAEARDIRLEDLEDNYANKRATYLVEKQAEIDELYAQGDARRASVLENEMKNTLAAMDAQYEQEKVEISQPYTQFGYELYDSTIKSSDLSDPYNFVTQLGQEILSGNLDLTTARAQYESSEASANSADLLITLQSAIEELGGIESAMAQYNDAKNNGDSDLANQIGSMILGYGIATNYAYNDYGDTSAYAFGNNMGVAIEPDTNQLSEAIDSFNGEEVTIDVEGDTTPARKSVSAINGQKVTIYAYADMSNAYRSFNEYLNYTASSGTYQRFAEGGRATTASIFGEAGAEWAIPEEHSQRTADLLASAANASGFTWPELLGLNGGLNGGSTGSTTIVYSPTIHANDTNGIVAALKRDKQELLKMLAEQSMLKEMEAYS